MSAMARAVGGLLLLVLCVATAHAQSRDWRKQPFTSTSPWNQPIGSGAKYADIANLAGFAAAMNYDDRWTSSIVVARTTDPVVQMLYSPPVGTTSTWTFLANGGKPCGNSAADEARLEAASSPTLQFEANYYSTLATPDTHVWQLPASFHKASSDARPKFYLPAGACPSPDSDGFMAVLQPDGWIVDVYAGVVLSNGKVLGTMASALDARGDGTGWWNGRRASMLPSLAGLIRNGEIAAGRIPHALAVQAPPAMLTTQAVWPAATFDRDAGYSGTIPMGSLLAIPPSVDVTKLGLTPQGVILARAAQDYGVYVVDRGGGGITFLAELGNPDIHWTNRWNDLAIVKNALKRVANNGPSSVGGGGTPRQPLAAPLVEAPQLTGIEKVAP